MGEEEGEEATCCSGGLSASSRSAHPAPRPSLSSAGSAGVRKALRHDTTLAGAVKPSQAHQQRIKFLLDPIHREHASSSSSPGPGNTSFCF